jgi:DNA-binding response OmpR family regulator
LARIDRERLHARLNALAYRLAFDDDDEDDHASNGLIRLIAQEYTVAIGPVRVSLRQPSFAIFAYLLPRRPHWVRTQRIMCDVFGTHHLPDSSIVRVHVHDMRRRLHDLQCIIEGKPRHGYRMNLHSEEARAALSRILSSPVPWGATTATSRIASDCKLGIDRSSRRDGRTTR